MKKHFKQVVLTAVIEIPKGMEDDPLFLDDNIKKDIKQELNCCSNLYEIQDMDILEYWIGSDEKGDETSGDLLANE